MAEKPEKNEAREMLMHAMMSAFYRAGDENKSAEFCDLMRKEAARVEKLLGFEPYSWNA